MKKKGYKPRDCHVDLSTEGKGWFSHYAFLCMGFREQETQDWALPLGAGMDAMFVFFFPEAAIFMSIVLDRELPCVPASMCVCVCPLSVCVAVSGWPVGQSPVMKITC